MNVGLLSQSGDLLDPVARSAKAPTLCMLVKLVDGGVGRSLGGHPGGESGSAFFRHGFFERC